MDSHKRKKKSGHGIASAPILPAQEKSEPLCDLHQGRVDNIMDTYLTDYPFDQYARVTKVSDPEEQGSVRQHCRQRDREPAGSKRQVSVEPSHTTYDLTRKNPEGPIPELDDGYFPYDQYFKQDTQTLKARLTEEEDAGGDKKVEPETDASYAVSGGIGAGGIRAEDDTEGDEYTYGHQALIPAGVFKTDTLDLLAYIGSGILLIFIMEQFLRIGLYMRA